MIYLIEPSTLRLNKMIRRDRAILSKIRGMKIVLNMSLLDSSDIKDFEGEAGCSVFHNVPPLDDKKDRHRVLDELLNKVNLSKATSSKNYDKFKNSNMSEEEILLFFYEDLWNIKDKVLTLLISKNK